MKKYTAIFAAASLAVAGLVFPANAEDANRTDTQTQVKVRTDDNSVNANTQTDTNANTLRNRSDTDNKGVTAQGEVGVGGANASGGVTLGGQDSDANAAQASAQSPQNREIKNVMSEITEAALTVNGVDDMVERFSQNDRQRFEQFLSQNPDRSKQLNTQIEQIRSNWQTKYGQGFAINNTDQIYNQNFNISLSDDLGDNARPAGERLQPSDTATHDQHSKMNNKASGDINARANADTTSANANARANTDAGLAGERSVDPYQGPRIEGQARSNADADTEGMQASGRVDADANTSSDLNARGDAAGNVAARGDARVAGAADPASTDHNANVHTNIKDRNNTSSRDLQNQQRANVSIQASHGLPQATLTFVNEGGDWKLDIPDQVTGQQLHDQLNSTLSQINQNQAQWPQDVNEAQRQISHRILLATQGQGHSDTTTGHQTQQ